VIFIQLVLSTAFPLKSVTLPFTLNAVLTGVVTPGERLFRPGCVYFGVMSQERTTLSAQVDTDTELAQQFVEYQQRNAMTSRSEAVRHLIRAGLEQELELPDDTDDSARERSKASDVDNSPVSIDFVRGNEAIIAGAAFLIGADGILESLTGVAGAAGSWIFIAIGSLLIVWVWADMMLRWRSDSAQGRDRARANEGAAD